ncbi:MAG: lysophospholipid acyltransferase family protein [Rubellimicrobium sp.]|nr:lysophospholipid acyltransferase family protein [Rubellimicrobium sp.]
MADKPAAEGTTADWLVDRSLRGLIAAARCLPYERRVPFVGAMLRQAIGPLAGYRRRSLENLALIWPDRPLAERKRIADAVNDNLGRTLIENYAPREFAAHLADAAVSGNGLAAIETARAEGRPVILVSGHFGNHEAPRHAMAARGHAVGAIYRNMRNPYVNAHYIETIAAVSGPVFAQGRQGTMGFARHLRNGGMAGILIDVRVRYGPEIGFLGHPARTSTSAAELALRFGATLVPCFGIRQADGLSFDIRFEDPIPHSDPLTMTQAMTERLEAQVIAHPGQWFWVHRRWKTPGRRGRAGDAAPDE